MEGIDITESERKEVQIIGGGLRRGFVLAPSPSPHIPTPSRWGLGTYPPHAHVRGVPCEFLFPFSVSHPQDFICSRP